MSEFKRVDGGVTAARGFRAAAVCAGIKGKTTRPDVALLASDRDAAVAGTFTTNRVQAAPVKLCRERLAGGAARAVVVNSGSANACTGPQGMRDAERTAAVAAEALGVDVRTVFVCSTGTIGIPLPMDRMEAGVREAARALSPDGGPAAARAIMTTDTVDKQAAVELRIDGADVRVGGMAKGAGMIEPNMATMLGFLTTDAAVEPAALQDCLSAAVRESFNRITVDGDQSTNDTVLLLANGAAGNRRLGALHPQWAEFAGAVAAVARDLAMKIVADGEGATCFVTVAVTGAASNADARAAARAVANSLLVKTSWFGGDPNWGRVMDAVGYSGAEVREERVDIAYDEVSAVRGGMKDPGTPLRALEEALRRKRFTLTVNLNIGVGTDTVYTCDCSEAYVKINSEYMT